MCSSFSPPCLKYFDIRNFSLSAFAIIYTLSKIILSIKIYLENTEEEGVEWLQEPGVRKD